MDVLEIIHDLVETKARNTKKDRIVVGIAGAGCIGKTTLCENYLKIEGASNCQVVSLDAYMLERQRREELGGITGYDPLGFEMDAAARQIRSLIEREMSFTIHQYNRRTHERDIAQRIEPKRIVLIEGCLALSDALYKLEDIHIFMNADQNSQYLFRLAREKREFKYAEDKIPDDRWSKYWLDYRKFIQPQIAISDVILNVSPTHKITVSKKPFTTLKKNIEIPAVAQSRLVF
jgi:uridine kinase